MNRSARGAKSVKRFEQSDGLDTALDTAYPMVKDMSHTPPLLLGTLFLSKSALLIVSLLSDPELKLTFSALSY